ncbi:Putative fungal transcription factor [Septoria linicola]|uniref:Fungal transcription factor n=1 Tax=Septoria linicola TaxID=215465 RepID=A0A9Q9B235_9PEZI|nr:putative fungal transcription factor [Septoria linicola]USW59240.1 Putative fungal transcription factor [Septoria linicola]
MTSNGLLMGAEPIKYHRRVLSLAQDHPYLLHAQLAIAALHLTTSGVKLYEKARLYNLSRTLQEYQKAIAKPIARQDSDPLVMTSMMINMLYFHCDDSSDESEPWLWSKSPQRLSWLSVQQGMGAILSQTRPHHCESGLLSNFHIVPHRVTQGRRLHPSFWTLCNVTHPVGPRGVHPNPYHDILHCLEVLMPLEPGIKSLMKYMHFCGRIYPSFISLVENEDYRALLILSYWFALLIGVGDLWWCKLRAKRDCLAICAYLDLEGNETIRDLLEFPATSCEYARQIQDLEESPVLLPMAVQAHCIDLSPWLDWF